MHGCRCGNTHLREVEVALLLEALQVRVHLPQLRLQVLDGFAWLRRTRTVAGDRGAAACSRPASVQTTRRTRGCRTEGRDGGGGVGGGATSPGDGVVTLPTVICVPIALEPLQELEVVSE